MFKRFQPKPAIPLACTAEESLGERGAAATMQCACCGSMELGFAVLEASGVVCGWVYGLRALRFHLNILSGFNYIPVFRVAVSRDLV